MKLLETAKKPKEMFLHPPCRLAVDIKSIPALKKRAVKVMMDKDTKSY